MPSTSPVQSQLRGDENIHCRRSKAFIGPDDPKQQIDNSAAGIRGELAQLPTRQDRPLQIIRRDEVLLRCGFKKSTLYAAMAEGRFPKAIRLGPRAVGWLAHEIDEWIAGRVEESRTNVHQ